MRVKVVIDERFNGPPRIVNGGYACATVAGALDRPAEVTLRRPVPVATPLLLTSDKRRATLQTDADELLAEAVTVDGLDGPVPAPISVTDAQDAMTHYPAHTWGGRMFPCFVCGPDRSDGFGVFPGPVPGRDVAAAVWRPDPALADGSGHMPDQLSSAVLDCTGSWSAIIHNGLQTGVFLGTMTTEILHQPAAGEPCIAVGWAGPREGRKLAADAALFTESGRLLARAHLLCIEPRPL
jgi:hypothetical protein